MAQQLLVNLIIDQATIDLNNRSIPVFAGCYFKKFSRLNITGCIVFYVSPLWSNTGWYTVFKKIYFKVSWLFCSLLLASCLHRIPGVDESDYSQDIEKELWNANYTRNHSILLWNKIIAINQDFPFSHFKCFVCLFALFSLKLYLVCYFNTEALLNPAVSETPNLDQ